MKLIKSKKAIALLASLVVVAAAAMGAYAYFTSTGTGTGSATVGTSTNFTVSPTNVPAASKLYPGGPAYAADGTVTNPSTGAQQLFRINATIVAPTGAGTDATKPACGAADFALSKTTVGSSWVLDTATTAHLIVNTDLTPTGTAGDHYNWSGLSVGMIDRQDGTAGDGTGNQDNCKNATANVKFDAS